MVNRSVFRLLTGLVLVIACADQPVSVQPANLPVTVLVVAGDSQTATVGSTLPIPLRFRVVNALGHPLPAETLDVSVAVGQGATVTAPTLITDSFGEASDVWNLGIRAGTQRVVARTRASLTDTLPAAEADAFATPGPLAIAFFARSRMTVLGNTASVTRTVALDSFSNRVPVPPVADLDGVGTVQQGESTFQVLGSIPGRFRFVLVRDTLLAVVAAPAGRMRLVHYRGDTVETLTGNLAVARWLESVGATTQNDSSLVYYDLLDAMATRSVGGVQSDSVAFPRLPDVMLGGVPWVMDSSGSIHPFVGRWWQFSYRDMIWPGGTYDSLTYHPALFGAGVWIARGPQFELGPKDSLSIQ